MPCSGLNNATSLRSFAAANRSIVLSPRRVRPVWFVTRPIRLPRSRAKPSASSTSIPVSVGGMQAPVSGAPPCARFGTETARHAEPSDRIEPASAAVISAAAATVATLPRNGVTSPLPSGCTRFDRKIT